MSGTDRAALCSLRDKYLALKHLREAAASGRGGDPRAEMAALAARFPGALRELDRLPLDEIDARLDALGHAIDSDARAPDWVRWQAAWHGWLRAALRIRRLVRGTASLEAALACVRAGYVAAADEPPLGCIDAAFVAAVLHPPEGRLTRWAFARVAAEYGTTSAEVEDAVFGRKAGDPCGDG